MVNGALSFSIKSELSGDSSFSEDSRWKFRHVGTLRASRFRAVQLLEFDLAECALDAVENLQYSHSGGTHRGGR